MNSNKFVEYTSHQFENVSFSWIIENYSLLKMCDLHNNLVSQWFSKYKFRLEINSSPNNLNMMVTLNKYIMCDKLNGIFRLYIQNVEKANCVGVYRSSSAHRKSLASWTDLFDKSKGLLCDDKLILHCDIKFTQNPEIKTRHLNENPSSNLRKDFGALFDTKEYSDVTILTADDHKIPVHKLILSVRCKVFAAMFKHPMQENKENCVTISDFNSDVVNEMLRFIYTGEAPNLKDMTADLMAAAEKYQLDKLKAMCAQSMSDNLSIETAPIVLKTAVIYNVEDLKSEAIRYIENNLGKVTETSNWKELLKSDKNLISEAFINPRLDDLKLNEDTSIKE